MHSVASLCVRDSEAAFVEMWVEQRGNNLYAPQVSQLLVSFGISLKTAFHRTGNTTHEISFVSVGVSCFLLLCIGHFCFTSLRCC